MAHRYPAPGRKGGVMAASLDMTLCRRCGDPMAAVVRGGALPRYLCRLCGDLELPAAPTTVRPAAGRDCAALITSLGEQVGLGVDIVVRRGPGPDAGRQPLHQPTARYPDQFPLHATALPQRHCA